MNDTADERARPRDSEAAQHVPVQHGVVGAAEHVIFIVGELEHASTLGHAVDMFRYLRPAVDDLRAALGEDWTPPWDERTGRAKEELSEAVSYLYDWFETRTRKRADAFRVLFDQTDQLEKENERLRLEVDRQRQLDEARGLARALWAAFLDVADDADSDLTRYLVERGVTLPAWVR